MPLDRPAEPWNSFLAELDAWIDEPCDLHCIGGFAVSQCYGFGRETADLDVLSIVPSRLLGQLRAVAGKGSPLQIKHRVFIEHVGVANYPDQYESRLVRVFPAWAKLRLWVLEAHDLALTKLERSNERDIRDVMYLAGAGLIRKDVLIERFENEMRPYMSGPTPTWHQTTLSMWVDACWPESH